MNKININEIEARAKAATEGPWINIKGQIRGNSGRSLARLGPVVWMGVRGFQPEQAMIDSEFIAHARTDIPDLIEYARELEKENDRLREMLDVFAEGGRVARQRRDEKKPVPQVQIYPIKDCIRALRLLEALNE